MAGRINLKANKVFGLPIDLVLSSVIGLLALAFVAGGNIYIEAEKADNPSWNAPVTPPEANFKYEEKELLSIEGWTDEGTTSDQGLGTLPENVTTVRAVLTWTDDIGSNDVLGLAITLNGTELGSAEGSNGNFELELSGNDTETGDEVVSGELGAGVTAVRCPGRVGPLPRDLDDGNGWALKVYVTVRTEA